MIDVAHLGRLLRQVEADNHRRGWDLPPVAYVLYDARAAEGATDRWFRHAMAASPRLRPATRVGPYVAQPMLDQSFFRQADLEPYEALRRFALSLAYASADDATAGPLRAALRQPGVLGFAVAIEAWGTRDQAAAQAAIHGGPHLGDVAGSVETRLVYAADLTLRVYKVKRQRGEQPSLDDNAGVYMRGDFTTSLRILVAAVTDTVPPIDEFEIHYPTLAQLSPLPGDPLADPPIRGAN